jgi:uncharacterized repeat protein (TIGR01451 family)
MRGWSALVLAAWAVVSFAGSAAAGPSDQQYPLDVDLADRVDPVRPGDDVVYELEVENFTLADAPGVVVIDHLPPGTSYLVAHREPDWAVVPAIVDGDEVRFELGSVAPCDQLGTPRCRDLWVVLRVDPGVAPGTAIVNRVSISSSNPALPPNEADIVTTVSSAALRSVKLNVGRPGRDRAQVRADLARNGLPTPLDPPTPTIDVSAGLALRIGVPGETPLFEVSIPAGEMTCTGPENPLKRVRCKPRDKSLWKPLGIARLELFLPGYLHAQRNNAQLALKLGGLDIPSATGPDFELVLEANGETYAHTVTLAPNKSGSTLSYTKGQGEL